MKYTEFTFIDILFTTTWLLIFTIIVLFINQKNKANPLYKFFVQAFAYKLVMGLLFAIVYVYVYGGGDTLAYWRGADVLNNLFYASPSEYFSELTHSYTDKTYIPSCYTLETGHPPYWIYFEPKSWFVSKISSLFSFFTFGSYLALNLFYSFLSFLISYRFFLFVNKITNIKSNLILIATVFIPSVSFWCGGVSKDTLTFCFGLIFIMSVWNLIYEKITLKRIVIILFSMYILLETRPFILIAVITPLLIILVFRINRHSPFIIKLLTRTIGIGVSLSIIFFFFRFSASFGEFSTTNLIQTAESTYTDFQKNEIYTGKRYDLGISDFSNASLIKVIPLSIATAIYRPFIWESETVLMTLNGLESVFLLFMSFQLMRKKKVKTTVALNDASKDFILFSISFVFIFGFFVGLTSGLFGVLSRLKAPILPFFMLFLFKRIHRETEPTSEETNLKESNQSTITKQKF